MVANSVNPRALLHQIADDAPDEVVESLTTVLGGGFGQGQIVAALEAAHSQLVTSSTGISAAGLLTNHVAHARQRGLWKRRELLQAEGPPWSGAQVAELLGLSRQAVDKRRRSGRLLGVTLGRRGYAYPAWQFDQAGVLPGLEAVLDDLIRHDAWMKIVFMLTPNSRLNGGTPLAALRRGQIERVRSAAQAYGEHGAA